MSVTKKNKIQKAILFKH